MFQISTDHLAPTELPAHEVEQMWIHDGTSDIFPGWIFHVQPRGGDYYIWCEQQPTEEEVRAASAMCSSVVYSNGFSSEKTG